MEEERSDVDRIDTTTRSPRPVSEAFGKPVSDRKREASRRNGRRSRGPKTERGKAISRLNAVTHALYSKLAFSDLHHLRGFEDAEQLLADLTAAYPPQTLAESIRLQKLVADLWREARATRFELRVTERDESFCNEWVTRATNYANAVHRLSENSLAILEKLDREARESDGDKNQEAKQSVAALGEVPPDPEVPPRKPATSTKLNSSGGESVA